MRKIVAALFVSVDGVVEAPNEFTTGHMDEEVGQELGAQMAARDTILLGPTRSSRLCGQSAGPITRWAPR
jgi:hypothetical protein